MGDTDLPSVFSDTVRKARREHKCCECQGIIKPGEKYHIFKGCWEGKWDEFKTCLDCIEVRDEIRSLYRDDEGPPFGDLGEWARESGITFPVMRVMP